MKTADYLKTLRGKSAAELRDELLALRKEQFNLRMQQATGQLSKTHLLGQVRRNIARVKTLMAQQVKAS